MELIVILAIFAVYLLFSLIVIVTTVVWANNYHRNAWLWGVLAAFMMYNLVFWDLIPTFIVHKYYCDTQFGLTVFKTPEQWKAENPDLTVEDLKPRGKNRDNLWDFPYQPLPSNPKNKVLMINQRIYLDGDYEAHFLNLPPISKMTTFIADNRNNERLAQLVTFGSGYGGNKSLQDLKFWLDKGNCSGLTGGDEEQATGYKEFIKQIIKLGE